jgi:hypothetical protein
MIPQLTYSLGKMHFLHRMVHMKKRRAPIAVVVVA